MSIRKILLISAALVLIAVASFLVFKDRDATEAPKPATQTNDTAKDTEQTLEKDDKNVQYQVKVFFSKRPESDDDPSKVFPVVRTSNDIGVGKFAVSQLLKGPNDTEKSQGYFSTARLREGESNCGGADFSLKIENTVATLQFCKQFDHIGSVSDGQAESELQATLKQFETVKKVVILNRQGDCEFNLSGLNLCKQ